MSPDLAAALAHPAVARHPAVKHLAGEAARLAKAKAAHQAASQAAEAYTVQLTAWQAAFDRAVAHGDKTPTKPPPPDYDLGRAANALVAEQQALVEATRMALADAAPDLVPQLAALADRVVGATAKSQVHGLPARLAELEQLRTVLVAVAKAAWAQHVSGYSQLDLGGLVQLALGPKDPHQADWSRFLTGQAHLAEAEAARREAEADMARKAAMVEPGQMVGTGFGVPPLEPPTDSRLAGRR